jgi:hypothetical protein
MARSLPQLILLTACAVLSVQAFADPSPNPEKKARKERDGTPSPEFENVRKALDALTPEQRKRFQENFWRWANLSPEEKKALRDREEVRKKFMEQDVQAAIQEAGLQLDGERRAQFIQRYGEERRKIEEQLRKETMEKRRPLVKEMIARLKSEFSGGAPAPSEPAIAPASTPVAPIRP